MMRIWIILLHVVYMYMYIHAFSGIKSIQCRRESITLVRMVIALLCEKYHTFYYNHIRALKVENKVLYDIG